MSELRLAVTNLAAYPWLQQRGCHRRRGELPRTQLKRATPDQASLPRSTHLSRYQSRPRCVKRKQERIAGKAKAHRLRTRMPPHLQLIALRVQVGLKGCFVPLTLMEETGQTQPRKCRLPAVVTPRNTWSNRWREMHPTDATMGGGGGGGGVL